MPFVRNEASAVAKDGDKLKVVTVKKHYKFPKDEEMVAETPKNNFLPKTPLKRKREDKEWIRSKAKSAIIPAETAAVLKPEYLFKEPGPLIVYLCNASLAMCTVCRFHHNQQRNLKFFQHELPAVKKEYNL
ncbi:hypothetical protein GCK72_021008 [Caenorhabditis remanei]|uniref:Uncharacterized protein n=1 Tax=Caenorhabditis remanei TaxID=31234 RepID=A0A6A5GID1_CAERE|nr:hypothetical protein GCK72_021008 [Caenorhabditis remanei]KAF1754446.1 hypothetical protein GCK72_021008 [Caenorhabditis remanei]